MMERMDTKDPVGRLYNLARDNRRRAWSLTTAGRKPAEEIKSRSDGGIHGVPNRCEERCDLATMRDREPCKTYLGYGEIRDECAGPPVYERKRKRRLPAPLII
jgi:hypothetical protein